MCSDEDILTRAEGNVGCGQAKSEAVVGHVVVLVIGSVPVCRI